MNENEKDLNNVVPVIIASEERRKRKEEVEEQQPADEPDDPGAVKGFRPQPLAHDRPSSPEGP